MTSSMIPLTVQMFPADGRADPLPVELLFKEPLKSALAAWDGNFRFRARSLKQAFLECKDDLSLADQERNVKLAAHLATLYAKFYRNEAVHIDAAASYQELPALLARLQSGYYTPDDLAAEFATIPKTTTGVVVAVTGWCQDDSQLAAVLYFDGSFNEKKMRAHGKSFFVGDDVQHFMKPLPDHMSGLLELRMLRNAIGSCSGPLDERVLSDLTEAMTTRCHTLKSDMCAMDSLVQREPFATESSDANLHLFEARPTELQAEKREILICLMHYHLRFDSPPKVLLLTVKSLAELLSELRDFKHSGPIFSEAATAFASLAANTTPKWKASPLREMAFSLFVDAGLSFQEAGLLDDAEAACCQALQLSDTKKRTEQVLTLLGATLDKRAFASKTPEETIESAWLTLSRVAIAGLLGENANYRFCMSVYMSGVPILLPKYSNKSSRMQFLAALPAKAADVPTVRELIRSTVNPNACSNLLEKTRVALERERAARATAACSSCHKEFVATKLKSCKCRAPDALYCSRECQVAHWPTHKLTCKVVVAPAVAACKASATPTANVKDVNDDDDEKSRAERARAEFDAMKLRHDEREAAEAAARNAAEKEKRARIAEQRANKAATPDAPLSRAGPSHTTPKTTHKATDAPTAAGRAKQEVAKAASLEAQRQHKAALKAREDERIAQAEEQAALRKLGDSIVRGD